MVKQTQSSACPVHGRPTRRSECSTCNAAYMRVYMQQRRRCNPDKELWKRARARALKFDLPFSLEPKEIIIPTRCPAIGIPLIIGGRRTANSPSLDRIVPSRGYVIGNVRVISDHANRLKGCCTFEELQHRAEFGAEAYRADYRRIAAYVEREILLADAWRHAAMERRLQKDWRRVAALLDSMCTHGLEHCPSDSNEQPRRFYLANGS